MQNRLRSALYFASLLRKNIVSPKVEEDDSESEFDDGPEDTTVVQSAPKLAGLASNEIENIIEGIGGLNISSRVLRDALDDTSATEPLPNSLTASTKSASILSATLANVDYISPFGLLNCDRGAIPFILY